MALNFGHSVSKMTMENNQQVLRVLDEGAYYTNGDIVVEALFSSAPISKMIHNH
jgi:hypothetical protein